ncbi:MAG: PQQ-dependent dehydrogenase, methanol/ethanol family, partial [Gemmatimonadales bacterium]
SHAEPAAGSRSAGVAGTDSATVANIGAPANGTWEMQAADYANTRYAPLDQIDTANVQRLQLAWSFATGYTHGHEGAPLVDRNTLYIVTPYPNTAYALDLSAHPPTIRWKFEPHPDPVAIGKACCDIVNRGWVLADGELIYNLLDAHTVAVDVRTGKEVWRTAMADVTDGVTMTMAPVVVNGKVFVGNSGGEMGVQGWIAALAVGTGKELWRAYSTGPDSMVRIGSHYQPFYAWLKGRDVGATSWPSDAWKHGAGAVWGWISYDPALNLIYYGTSNPGPWNQAQRQGDNLFTSSVLARNPDTGELYWAYSFTPHDQWDYDGVNEDILVDLPIHGRVRHALVHFNRNGFAYTIDRATGEVLIAEPFGYQNWAKRIDLATGRPDVVAEKTTHPNEWTYQVCPPDIGVKDQQPAAYSPRTRLFYVPTHHMCMDYRAEPASYIAGTPYWNTHVKRNPAPGKDSTGHEYRGELIAWDAATGHKVWGITDKFPVYSGVLTTGGDLVFYGTVGGLFRAINARTGRILWQRKLGSGIIGAPMTFLDPDGKQYVAILAGVGGAAGVVADIPGYPAEGGTLYVFALPPLPAEQE